MTISYLKLLHKISKYIHLKKDETVFQQGEPSNAIYKVIKGQVHLYRHDIEGKRGLLYRAYDNNFFAEASLNSNHYHCTAVCILPSEIQVINASKMKNLLQKDPQFSSDWIAHLSSEIRHQRASVERLMINSASERIRHYLITEGDSEGELRLKCTLTELAEVLGISRETLYRTLAKMERQGRIERIQDIIRLRT